MFQDIEGLLRQIRERAEEASVWTEDQLQDFTQTVTFFTRSLEQEGEQISQRARSEYQRIREKLSQALRG
jgi:C4-type Zn-finger protein